MIVIDGEKYACEACIKGHRVSSCHHKERQLQHVNKKGRPVSQCQHCRGLRKARSAHIKCLCADHAVKEGGGDQSPSADTSCNCVHGLPCTCAFKRDIPNITTMPKPTAHNVMHRRAHSYNRPVMSNHRSESALPIIQPSQHTPTPISKDSLHEPGRLRKLRKFNASTGQINIQRSLDHFPIAPKGSITQPSTPYPSLTVSEHSDMRQIKTEMNSPALPPVAVTEVPNPFPGLNLSLMNSALSPANPSRYSLNDFSSFTWPTGNDINEQQSVISGMSEQSPYQDLNWSLNESSYDYNNDSMNQIRQRSSMVSIEQPGLSHSPSASTSDIGDLTGSFSDAHFSNSPVPAMTINPSWMTKDTMEMQNTGIDMPSYQAETHNLVYRPVSQAPPNCDDYFTAPVTSGAPYQTQADPYDESQFLTPTYDHRNYGMVPQAKFEDHAAWSMQLQRPEVNFELQNHQQQHQQQHYHQQMHQDYSSNPSGGHWQ